MKRIYSLLALSLLGVGIAQETNIQGLKALQHKFKVEQQNNQKFIKQHIAKKGVSSENLRKHLVGKYGNILVYIEPNSLEQILVSNTDMLYNNTLPDISVTGAGMNIFQWDGGRVDTNHQEFGDRVTNMEGEGVSLSFHSTAVASIMVASGVDEQAKGIAFEGNLNAYDYYDNFNEIAEESANNPEYMISNHSYGYLAGWAYGNYDESISDQDMWYWFGYPHLSENESVLNGLYSPLDQNFDLIAQESPNHLIIKSAGNSRGYGPGEGVIEHAAYNENDEFELFEASRPVNCGVTDYDCIAYGSVAKNILIVGSINEVYGNGGDGRYNGPDSVTPSSFSSFGPADDGRVKPDIVAQGSSVYVASLDNGYYAYANGTSGSAPNVAGVATLLQQINNQLEGAYLTASELKALLLNTTNETGQNPGPDYRFGFGLVDAFQAAKLLVDSENEEAIVLSNTLSLEPITYSITAYGDEPIRATMVWIDPAYNAEEVAFELNNRTPMLINDLDIRITKNSDSQVYMPWVLDVENPAEAAVTGDNVVDNVEQIYIASPSNENYTITVSHKGELINGEQQFALVLSGARFATQSTSNENKEVFSIYPNPVKDVVSFNGVSQNVKVQIFNLEGKLLLNRMTDNNTLNISDLAKGIYLMLVTDGDKTYSKKLIKE